MLWLILSLSARAETFTLDNDAIVVGMLADYNMRGSCQISVTDGPYSGAILTVPCERIVRFERDAVAAAPPIEAPAPIVVSATIPVEEAPIIEEVVVAEPEPTPVPLAQPVDAPFATEENNAPEPVEAVASIPEPAPAPAPTPAPAPEAADSGDGDLWSEAPASAAATTPATPDRPAIGGVVLPQLPNLRMMRRPADEAVEAQDEL